MPELFKFETFRMFGWTEADLDETRARTVKEIQVILQALTARAKLDGGG